MTPSKKFIPEFETAVQFWLEQGEPENENSSKDSIFSDYEDDEICNICNQNHHRHVQSFDDVKTSIDHFSDLLKKRMETPC